MKLSLNWLSNFVNLDDITAEEVALKLTMGAFEVEGIHKVGRALKGPILIGKILEIQKHPNADKLSVTTVTTDNQNRLTIVCGAKNIKEGQLVPVSLPGAVVVNRKDGTPLVIKEAKIREVESSGMLLSPPELGINSGEIEGILILPKSAKLGQSVIDFLSLKQDIVLEVGSRSNRGDALSVYGLSKEISALTGKKLKKLTFQEPKTDSSIISTACKIENLKDTYLFYTATVEDIEIKESPSWLKDFLASIGIRSINNIVDITNYINFSFGQPMHAYDKAKLNGELTARLAKNGEKIVTLDGNIRELKEDLLVIADNKTPVAIAGIMGAKDSEVTEKTRDIVFEAAVFNPVRVRKSSRKTGLSSESSKRFERGVDSSFTYKALLKAIELVYELATSLKGSKPKVGKIQQAGSPIEKNIKISLSSSMIKRFLNIDLKPEEALKILSSLDFTGTTKGAETLEVKVPESRNNDITRPADLIEEIARLYGYDKIPALPPPGSLSANKLRDYTEIVKYHLLSAGFSETYLSSLIGEQILSIEEFGFNNLKAVKMLNPISREHSVLRQSLIPGLLEALKLNINHQLQKVRLFEIGKVYFSGESKSKNEKETGVIELCTVAGIVSGTDTNWLKSKEIKLNEHLFFWTKGILENLFEKITGENKNYTFIVSIEKFLHPNFALRLSLNKNDIGYIGCLHPETQRKLEITEPVIVFEMNLESVLTELEKVSNYRMFKKISTQPGVERDITIDISKKYYSNELYKQISEIKSSFVTDINLISIYELDKNTRSLTFRLKMQDPDRTLTSKEVEDEVKKVINHLTSCFQAKFRV